VIAAIDGETTTSEGKLWVLGQGDA